MSSDVRVRFALNPTEYLHVGDARIAILNWIFSTQKNGEFVLRVRDAGVDAPAEYLEAENCGLLNWLGIQWREGVGAGGEFGPYRQSERHSIYHKYLEVLKAEGGVYPCCKTPDELNEIMSKGSQGGAAGPYIRELLEASADELSRAADAGQAPAWFFSVTTQEIGWTDFVKGDVFFSALSVGDTLVMHPNGQPSQTFAAVVDDALMNISHVLLSATHLARTPLRMLIFRALGFAVPAFGHVPAMLGVDDRLPSLSLSTLSLRAFKELGYTPETLMGYLATMGMPSSLEQEALSLEKLSHRLSVGSFVQPAVVFDQARLNEISRCQLQSLSSDEFALAVKSFLGHSNLTGFTETRLTEVLVLLHSSIDFLAQAGEMVEPLFSDFIRLKGNEALAIVSKDVSHKVYWAFMRYLNSYDHIDIAIFRAIMKDVQNETGIMGRELWAPIRVALTGKTTGPDLATIVEIMGKEKVAQYIQNVVDYSE